MRLDQSMAAVGSCLLSGVLQARVAGISVRYTTAGLSGALCRGTRMQRVVEAGDRARDTDRESMRVPNDALRQPPGGLDPVEALGRMGLPSNLYLELDRRRSSAGIQESRTAVSWSGCTCVRVNRCKSLSS